MLIRTEVREQGLQPLASTAKEAGQSLLLPLS